MGDSLGGRPDDADCYDERGNVDYVTLKTRPFYEAGIARLQKAHEQPAALVLMCSELKPEQCHRSKLMSRTLDEPGIVVQHIDETGGLRSQAELNKARTREVQMALFSADNEKTRISEFPILDQ